MTYEDFAAAVKKFGYGGITHLNHKHIDLCFSHLAMNESKSVYFFEEDYESSENSRRISVNYLLKIAILLCSHKSQQEQLTEMWLLVNPYLNDTVERDVLIEFV